MTPGDALLALQLGDSAFPSGTFVASYGLEVLAEEGEVVGEEGLNAFVRAHLSLRWATLERWAIVHAHRAGGDLDRVSWADHQLDALSWPPAARAASRTAGDAMLGVHERLGWAVARTFRRLVVAGASPGHQAVAEGLVAAERGLDEQGAALVAGHRVATGLASAGIRLGVVGHLGAQRVLDDGRATLVEVLARPLPEAPHGFSPAADAAMARHGRRTGRLFSC